MNQSARASFNDGVMIDEYKNGMKLVGNSLPPSRVIINEF